MPDEPLLLPAPKPEPDYNAYIEDILRQRGIVPLDWTWTNRRWLPDFHRLRQDYEADRG